MLLLTLLACGHDDAPSPITSDPGAPFALAGTNMLFATSAANNDQSSRAVLLITDGTVTCDDIAGQSWGEISDSVLASGDGLVFTPSWMWWGYYGTQPEDAAFTGLFQSYSQSMDGVYRMLATQYWTTSYLYTLEGATSFYSGSRSKSWLRLDVVDEMAVTGAFQTPFWSGTFVATPCGAFDVTDTGWQGYDTGTF